MRGVSLVLCLALLLSIHSIVASAQAFSYFSLRSSPHHGGQNVSIVAPWPMTGHDSAYTYAAVPGTPLLQSYCPMPVALASGDQPYLLAPNSLMSYSLSNISISGEFLSLTSGNTSIFDFDINQASIVGFSASGSEYVYAISCVFPQMQLFGFMPNASIAFQTSIGVACNASGAPLTQYYVAHNTFTNSIDLTVAVGELNWTALRIDGHRGNVLWNVSIPSFINGTYFVSFIFPAGALPDGDTVLFAVSISEEVGSAVWVLTMHDLTGTIRWASAETWAVQGTFIATDEVAVFYHLPLPDTGELKALDAETGDVLWTTLVCSPQPRTALLRADNSSFLAVACQGADLVIYDFATGTQTNQWKNGGSMSDMVAINSTLFIVTDGSLVAWDILDDPSSASTLLRKYDGGAHLAVDNEGRIFYGSAQGTVMLAGCLTPAPLHHKKNYLPLILGLTLPVVVILLIILGLAVIGKRLQRSKYHEVN